VYFTRSKEFSIYTRTNWEEPLFKEKKHQRLFQFEAIPALRPLCFEAVRLTPVRIFHSDLGRFWYNQPGIA
jgi:hypothetical protein